MTVSLVASIDARMYACTSVDDPWDVKQCVGYLNYLNSSGPPQLQCSRLQCGTTGT
jgi:hypothetical protein